MAEAIVSFVAERLHNLVVEEAKFLHELSGEVDQIQIELKRMQCFLKDADAKRDDNERICNWVAEIREVAYETEDVIETFVLRVASRRGGGVIQVFLKHPACILNQGMAGHKVGLEIRGIKTKISELTRSLQTYGISSISEGEGSSNSAAERQLQFRRSYSHVVEEDFIGLEADVEKLVAVLVNEDEDEDKAYGVVSICGMGGLGKTTIAQKVYNHLKVKHHFDGFAWVCISQQWQTRHILQRILIKLIPYERNKIEKMEVEELVGHLYRVQRNNKCLVVLDDIWSMDAWDCLKHAFPIGKMGTKLLLTTRNREVALHVDPNGFLHEPRFLNEDESWELLQKKAFSKAANRDTRDDKKLEELGRKMVVHCGGLPLAVAVLGGILVTKQKLGDWEMVHQNINSYIRRGKCMGKQQPGGVSQVLALSYSDLPYHLKPCFLYIGGFPEDFELETEKLYQLWLAEGMVSSDYRAEEETMMDVAERYLGELAQRYMVQVQIDELSGRFEYCRLHDLMRDLCVLKAKEENFLKVIDFRHEKELPDSFSTSSIGRIRRVSIFLGEDQDKYVLPEEITARHLRSVIFFVPNRYLGVPMPRMLKSHLNSFKLLRVLDLDRILYSKKLAKSIGKLMHLRYLGLKNAGFRKLPSSISNLGCLQTLDLRLHQKMYVRAIIPNVIWKLKNLRHLYLHDNICNTKEKLRLDGLNMLEILETFYTSLFDVNDLFKLTNLWKLKASIEPTLEDLVGIVNYLSITANRLRYSSFYIDYKKFCSAEELTLLRQLVDCHRLNTLHIRGVLAKLPEQHHFSPSLTTLEFSISELKEDPMETLEKLPNLRSLTLGPCAFVGVEMVCSATGFRQLKFLQLQKLPNFERWRVDEGAMPNLFSLQIDDCNKLSEVPDGLRFLTTLQELKIKNMGREFQKRLQVKDGEEGEDFHKVRHVPSITFSPIYYDHIPISALPECFRRFFRTE
ncbi:hypothetical protein F0562_035341 [Nyssa sinensis]|uniref:AAA+ ATPase domain-containing protein n=1 Tax=Nyssa sinensis TaxID=561372 RepID=A0A5J5AB69_9ASTE|nr:hypothetical protein F0562_035341 [Nyssa sinensis]